MRWDASFDQRCEGLAANVVQGDTNAWRELLVLTSGHVETWAARHPTLRRWRLDGPDDRRAVLVRVIERMAAHHYRALADFVARRKLQAERDPLVALARLDEIDEEVPSTPFAAWLRAVFRYALLDHVHHRLGWRDGAGRRMVGSDADPLRTADEPNARPALTDGLAVAQRMQSVYAVIDTLPAEMAAAIRRWAEGDSFGEVAAELGLADADAARRLVRAGHARLRDALRRVSEE